MITVPLRYKILQIPQCKPVIKRHENEKIINTPLRYKILFNYILYIILFGIARVAFNSMQQYDEGGFFGTFLKCL